MTINFLTENGGRSSVQSEFGQLPRVCRVKRSCKSSNEVQRERLGGVFKRNIPYFKELWSSMSRPGKNVVCNLTTFLRAVVSISQCIAGGLESATKVFTKYVRFTFSLEALLSFHLESHELLKSCSIAYLSFGSSFNKRIQTVQLRGLISSHKLWRCGCEIIRWGLLKSASGHSLCSIFSERKASIYFHLIFCKNVFPVIWVGLLSVIWIGTHVFVFLPYIPANLQHAKSCFGWRWLVRSPWTGWRSVF